MTQEWYVKAERETRGPFSAVELKQLALKGEILPDSFIRLNPDGKWRKASQVKGLNFRSDGNRVSLPTLPTAQWVVKRGEKLIGPVSSTQLQRLVEKGHVTRNTTLRRESDGRWIEAKNLEGLSFTQGSGQSRSQPTQRSSSSSLDHETENPYQSPVFTEDQQLKIATKSRSSGLEKISKGLWLVYYGICAVLLAGVVGIFMGLLGSVGGDVLSVVLGLVGIIAGGVGYISILTGQIMCIAVPRESNARKPCQIALGLQCASIALYGFSNFILPILITVGAAGFKILVFVIGLLAVVNPLITLAGYLCFLSFLKNLSIYINRKDLSSVSAKIAVRVIVTSVMLFCLLVSPFLLIVLPGLGMAIALYGVLVIVLAIVVFLTFIVTFVKYANHVRAVAEAVNV